MPQLFKKDKSGGGGNLFKKATSGAKKFFKKDGILDKAVSKGIEVAGSTSRILREGGQLAQDIGTKLDESGLDPTGGLVSNALKGAGTVAQTAGEGLRQGRKIVKDTRTDLREGKEMSIGDRIARVGSVKDQLGNVLEKTKKQVAEDTSGPTFV